jgi:O-antigen/teichoic acid export membrane protein
MTTVLWTWVAWLVLSIGVTRRWIRLGDVVAVRPSPVGIRELLRFGLPLLPMIAGEWLLRFQDQYFLLGLMDPEAVADYVMCRNVALIGFMVGASVLEIMCTELFRLRNQLATDDIGVVAGSSDAKRHFSAMLRFTLIVWAPLAIVMAIAPEDIIHVISDPEKYLAAASTMRWTIPLPWLFMVWMILSRTLMAFDRTRLIGAVTLAGALLSSMLHLVLIPLVGEAGAALAAGLSLTAVNLVLAARLKAWQWISLPDLMPVRSLLWGAAGAGGFLVLQPLLPGESFARLLGCGGWCLGCAFALGLFKQSDLQLMAVAFGTSDDQGR